jgi:hypothetical protein
LTLGVGFDCRVPVEEKGAGMKRKLVYLSILCVALTTIWAWTAAPAGAIIDGQQDATNIYSNVGMLETLIPLDDTTSVYWPHGSCTLVRNDKGGTIVLTAAHCVDWLFDEDGQFASRDTYVSFQPMTDLPWESVVWDGMTPPRYLVTRAVMHPDYVAALASLPSLGNAKPFGIGPGREDVALLWLDRKARDVPPAPIVSEGGIDLLDLKTQIFTVVGYGLNGFATGSYMSRGSVTPYSLWSGRNYRDVSVVSEHDLFPDRYLKVSESVCFHDSGGPTFYRDPDDGSVVVVAISVWGGSMRCEGPAYEYRLDTASAQGFLGTYLRH